MHFWPAIANSAWVASAIPAYKKFRATLSDPDRIQAKVLQEIQMACQGTDTWRQNFESIEPRQWSDMAPLVERAAAGETKVLSHERITHFEPTSGSSTARKLIPSTPLSRRQFNRAVSAWIANMYLGTPGLLGGRSYWSISPAVQHEPTRAGIKVGYEDDSEYLGRISRWLVHRALAVPAGVRHLSSGDFQRATLLFLLADPGLRLVSIWNPTFLTALLDYYDSNADDLWYTLERGVNVCGRQLRRRRTDNPWPELRLISCWADGQAASQVGALRERLHNVELQPKGLLATEAFVSFPCDGRKVIASTSHYFEFLTDAGRLMRLSELREGDEVSVVVTTGAGLVRYCLGDRVVVTGMLGKTPCIDFIGRDNIVSDLCGEKLNEAFVGRALTGLGLDGFAMLVPRYDHYVLYTTTRVNGRQIDDLLAHNFHFGWAQQLGQLKPTVVVLVANCAAALYIESLENRGRKRGDIKPVALDHWQGWHDVFATVTIE